MASRRAGRSVVTRDTSPGDSSLSLTVKVPANKLRQATSTSSRRSEPFSGAEILSGKRNRGSKKSYVVDSSPDDDDEDEEEPQLDDDDEEDEDMAEDDDDDVEDMDVDEDEEEPEDAEGELDVPYPATVPPPVIKLSRSDNKLKLSAGAATSKALPDDDEDDEEDDDLSDPADSEIGDTTMGFGDETMADDDAEGEDIEGDDDADQLGLDSDEDGSQDIEPDLNKMTKRQRARFEDIPQEYMKLSDEVQAKKVFTAEELSMRRQEMARRRRNLSEKRNEEVKMETINKLLKKQAPKINRKAAAAAALAEETPEDESAGISPAFIRWVSNKNGSIVAVPKEMLNGPSDTVFKHTRPPLSSGKMVEEVA